jgi:wyosine [tRNA(Phe)-imidazoG37] synthetase (radical SAM superfamily)
LLKVDKAIVKLDAGDDQMLKLIDRPKGRLPIQHLIENIKSFEGELIIQTMFLRGSVQGRPFDNSKGLELDSWLEKIKILAPKEVMLYSLDRDTPLNTLEAISKTELDGIAEKLSKLNIHTNVV